MPLTFDQKLDLFAKSVRHDIIDAARGRDVIIFPGKLLRVIEKHFDQYVSRLRDPAEVALRTTFEEALRLRS